MMIREGGHEFTKLQQILQKAQNSEKKSVDIFGPINSPTKKFVEKILEESKQHKGALAPVTTKLDEVASEEKPSEDNPTKNMFRYFNISLL